MIPCWRNDMVLASCRHGSQAKDCDTHMISVWSETVYKGYNIDIMIKKILKR